MGKDQRLNLLTEEDVERIVSDILQKMPEQLSLSDIRNLICELLFGLGLNPDDLPILLLLIVVVAKDHCSCSRLLLPFVWLIVIFRVWKHRCANKLAHLDLGRLRQ